MVSDTSLSASLCMPNMAFSVSVISPWIRAEVCGFAWLTCSLKAVSCSQAQCLAQCLVFLCELVYLYLVPTRQKTELL